MRNLNDIARIARQLRNQVATVLYRDASTGRYIATPFTLNELAFFRKPAGDL